MNPFDPLETELLALRPRAPSAELKRRVVDRLDTFARQPTHRPWEIALAGALAAACLAAIALWRNDPQGESKPVAGQRGAPAADRDDAGPTVLAYRNALVRSPEDFSALLDKHAEITLPHDPARNGVRAFVRPDVKIPSWTGEL
jgi:hypothetical protein